MKTGALTALCAALCLCLQGCATSELVVWNARQRVELAPDLAVRSAAIVDETLYLRLGTGESTAEGQISESFVEVSLDPSTWQEEEAAEPLGVKEHWSHKGGFHHRLVPTHHLKPTKDWPRQAPDIETVDLGSIDVEELARSIENAGPGVNLFSAELSLERFRHSLPAAYLDSKEPSRRILVVVGAPALGHEAVAFDFYTGHHRQLGWYALAPLTVALDVATAPIQVLVVLLAGT